MKVEYANISLIYDAESVGKSGQMICTVKNIKKSRISRKIIELITALAYTLYENISVRL